jgi:hypothetical protein
MGHCVAVGSCDADSHLRAPAPGSIVGPGGCRAAAPSIPLHLYQASSYETEPAMIMSSPWWQFTGVATFVSGGELE